MQIERKEETTGRPIEGRHAARKLARCHILRMMTDEARRVLGRRIRRQKWSPFVGISTNSCRRGAFSQQCSSEKAIFNNWEDSMKAEVVSIGSELSSGVRLDTNGQWLAAQLAQIGVDVIYHSTVADDLPANLDVFRHAQSRADLVLVTGGLGPTKDDLTREVLAEVAGVPLEFHEPSLQWIESIFKMFNRPMPERNRVQAMFPVGSEVITNPNGTAPGIWLKAGNACFVCLPGVPREMKPMFTDWVVPRLRQEFSLGEVIVHRTIRCFGAGESQIEEMLGDLTKRGRQPEVGITASEATISLRVTAKGANTQQAQQLIEPDARFIYEKLGELIFGEDDVELHHAVAKALIKKNVTISTAESCTGGMLGQMLTDTPGISQVYLGGYVTYSNDLKINLLGVPADILSRHGAVSEECAAAMAKNCRERTGSDLAVSITGIAGPDGGTPEKPVGLVYVGLASSNEVKVRNFKWGNDRKSTRVRAAKMALNLVRLQLLRRDC
jgi:nicotinamide-nucleotide amidase